MGGFPCYFASPLRPAWDRVIQVGDASASQSPLSFGGFGAMVRGRGVGWRVCGGWRGWVEVVGWSCGGEGPTPALAHAQAPTLPPLPPTHPPHTQVRHLPRLSEGVGDALRCDRLSRRDLAWLQPYQPALSVSWLLQRSMSVGVGQLTGGGGKGGSAPSSSSSSNGASSSSNGTSSNGNGAHGSSGAGEAAPRVPPWRRLPPGHVNKLLACTFGVMRVLGDRALRPFLQDTMQLLPLAATMAGMSLR